VKLQENYCEIIRKLYDRRKMYLEGTRIFQNNKLHHGTPTMMKLAPKITQFLSADSHLEKISSFSRPNLFQFTANLIIYYTNNEGSGISSIRRRSHFTEVITHVL
jgi:hypothetical protein